MQLGVTKRQDKSRRTKIYRSGGVAQTELRRLGKTKATLNINCLDLASQYQLDVQPNIRTLRPLQHAPQDSVHDLLTLLLDSTRSRIHRCRCHGYGDLSDEYRPGNRPISFCDCARYKFSLPTLLEFQCTTTCRIGPPVFIRQDERRRSHRALPSPPSPIDLRWRRTRQR